MFALFRNLIAPTPKLDHDQSHQLCAEVMALRAAAADLGGRTIRLARRVRDALADHAARPTDITRLSRLEGTLAAEGREIVKLRAEQRALSDRVETAAKAVQAIPRRDPDLGSVRRKAEAAIRDAGTELARTMDACTSLERQSAAALDRARADEV